jgi:hypothetical protein
VGGLCRSMTVAYIALGSLSWLGCKHDESSSLRDRSTPTERTPGVAPTEPRPTDAPTEPATPSDPEDAGPLSELVTLALAMPEGREYRVTTFAMVELPMVNKPVGWAREERISFEDCTGDGLERACSVRHASLKFEGQPPTGAILEADERKVRGVTSLHAITATGYREGETRLEVEGELDASLRETLASIHRLYCIRFPKEPIGVGAKWNDTCRTFDRGVAITRNLAWELSELTDDPEEGKRAELRAIGEYVVPGDDGDRKGTVEMILYFFVDHGEPHLLRERRSIPVSEQRGAYTKETINIQFAKVDPQDPERLVRTDERPFPTAQAGADAEPDQAPEPESAPGPK